MSLISEINRTNTSKEKAKTVAVKIDNKLVELGGEQAINLADVPNKMQKMVVNNYAKFAKFPNGTGTSGTVKPGHANRKQVEFDFNFNVDFVPTFIFFKIQFSIRAENSYGPTVEENITLSKDAPTQSKKMQSSIDQLLIQFFSFTATLFDSKVSIKGTVEARDGSNLMFWINMVDVLVFGLPK